MLHHSGIVQVGGSNEVSFRQQMATPVSEAGSHACLFHTHGHLLLQRSIIGLTNLSMCLAKMSQSVKRTGCNHKDINLSFWLTNHVQLGYRAH